MESPLFAKIASPDVLLASCREIVESVSPFQVPESEEDDLIVLTAMVLYASFFRDELPEFFVDGVKSALAVAYALGAKRGLGEGDIPAEFRQDLDDILRRLGSR